MSTKSLALLFFLIALQINLSHERRFTIRHKRQHGAHLYLPESSVIPDGEGDASQWSEWGTPSDCSRTCGGGVAYQTRECRDVDENGASRCTGGDKKYFSCNTQDCSHHEPDFRRQQCSRFDTTPFEGVSYNWVPYTKAPNPCELNCMPVGERFYYRHGSQVIDGTRCNAESFDVCVAGTCQPVGCDLMLGSSAREDKCRKCQGDGSSCKTVSSLLDMGNLQVGYNDILLIPAGATNIEIQERAPSNNYLAIRNLTGHYHLNGNYRIDFPRPMQFAGSVWHYERRPQGFAAPDKLTCIGPTTEAVYLVLLSQDRNVGINYEYSVPQSAAPEEPDTYAWAYTQFEACSVSCGGGHQSRNVSCNSRTSLQLVDDTLCDSSLKPAEWQKCGQVECAPKWVEGKWGKCSAPCGQNGTQNREVTCNRVSNNGTETTVEDSVCLDDVGNKPANVQSCNQESVCPEWFEGKWQPCSKLCGEGNQKRNVVCYKKTENGRITVLKDEECPEEKPAIEQKCMHRPCEGVDYITSSWSDCDECGTTMQTRLAYCASKDGTIYDDKFCANREKPALSQECIAPPCEYMWFSSQWSKCSAICGKGAQTRSVVCGKFDGEVVRKAEDESKCDMAEKPEAEKECEGPEECPAEWFAGPWSTCSKSCGTGNRERKVICLAGGKAVEISKCVEEKILFGNEPCNTDACTDDDLLMVDTTAMPMEDDDEEEYCTDEESSGDGMEDSTDMPSSDLYSTDMEDGVTKITEDMELSTGIELDSSPTTESSLITDELMMSDSTGESDSTASDMSTDVSPTELEDEGSGYMDYGKRIGEGDSGTEAYVTGQSDSTDLLTTMSEGSGESTSDSSASVGDLTSEIASSSAAQSTESSISSSQSNEQTSESSQSKADTTMSKLDMTTQSTESSDTTTEPPTTVETTTPEDQTTESQTTQDDVSPTISSTDSKTELTTEKSSSNALETTTSNSEEVPDEDYVANDNVKRPSNKVSDDDMPSTTDKSGSTETTDSETGTTESTEATESSQASESTEKSVTESTEEGFTGSTDESSTDSSDSTIIPESTTESDMSSSDSEATTIDIWSTTSESDSTDESETNIDGTTPNTIATAIRLETLPKKCKARPKKPAACLKAEFGCCPDEKTTATGPFDQGCPIAETCKETKHGCCPDGLSPAQGPNDRGCPESECAETLFGCCPDKITPSEGNDNENCPVPTTTMATTTVAVTPKPEKTPTKPKHCSDSKFGCCQDGKTDAEGADFKGCKVEKTGCHATPHGCCQDEKTPASGPKFEGCSACINELFGCCQDGKTPAHGPNQEGCCLDTEFGCCPNNINAASGAQLEGCGCEYSPYRCCPDGKTSATGHDNEGCGCQYARFGCCPDKISAATGEKFEGCPCHSFQFGCCPDGVTVATGPQNQGCQCSLSKFKCCSDSVTPAKGPNFEGCTCAESKFGCCLDGTTDAQGKDFEGCEMVPESRQKGCSLKKDMGTCNNFTVKYFFDVEYGGCSRFWYGGCDGNNNRFETNDECKEVCEQPTGKDMCHLPKIHGPCTGYYPMWHYDTDRNTCTQFIYGGCLGNNNRFESLEDCQSQCQVDEAKAPCEQPIESGPCGGSFERWAFDKEADLCRPFTYGGCQANKNNHASESACNYHCKKPGVKKQSCNQPKEAGSCDQKHARWAFSNNDNKCMPFYFTGCGGNENSFVSEEQCIEQCPPVVVKDVCEIPSDAGECQKFVANWFFDTKLARCRQFYYGGCGGNGNNFKSEEDCEKRCSSARAPPPRPPVITERFSPSKEHCLLPSAGGNCHEQHRRYYYDTNYGSCEQFIYTGCNGNENSFESLEECESLCSDAQDPCSLRPSYGRCSENQTKWYFDNRVGNCYEFAYSGCSGNRNNFDDRGSCESSCSQRRPDETPDHRPAPVEPSRNQTTNICELPSQYGDCRENVLSWYFEPETSLCTAFYYSGCGGNGNRFASEGQCERQCGEYRGIDVCRQELDSGPCDEWQTRYYYDNFARKCQPFSYGGCEGNGNKFVTEDECSSLCIGEEEPEVTDNRAICSLRPETGVCTGRSDYLKRWHFDESRGTCVSFIFSGCAGNQNNFRTYESCLDYCQESSEHPEPEPQPRPTCERLVEECRRLQCPYGLLKNYDSNGCTRCQCDNPCQDFDCNPGTSCAVDITNDDNGESSFVAVCRMINKPGRCPTRLDYGRACDVECNSDADCRGEYKCCAAGCSTVCVSPDSERAGTTQQTPYYPDAAPPKLEEVAPEKLNHDIPEGGVAVLRCYATGFPPPSITWKKGSIELNTNQGRFLLTSSGDLQIVQLHRTDSGTYVCIADNGVGAPVERRVNIQVTDPKEGSAYILGDTNSSVIATLTQPAMIRCAAGGYPKPFVTWWRGDQILPLKADRFEITRDYSIVFSRVELHDLGQYVCQAYNAYGKPVSKTVFLRARGPVTARNDEDRKYLQYLVNAPEAPSTTPRTRPSYPYRPSVTQPRIIPSPIIPHDVTPRPRVVPLTANVILSNGREYNVGSDISMTCEVTGYPEPEVTWYKNGNFIATSSRVQIPEPHRLIISNAEPDDSGRYRCSARNSHSNSMAEETITVEGAYLPPDCTDNSFFANCKLIVQAKYCNHKYYAKFCCKSCSMAGLLQSHPNQV